VETESARETWSSRRSNSFTVPSNRYSLKRTGLKQGRRIFLRASVQIAYKFRRRSSACGELEITSTKPAIAPPDMLAPTLGWSPTQLALIASSFNRNSVQGFNSGSIGLITHLADVNKNRNLQIPRETFLILLHARSYNSCIKYIPVLRSVSRNVYWRRGNH
jgi:hypothetical protein